MSLIKRTLPLLQQFRKCSSTTGNIRLVDPKIRTQQELFQTDNGLPVHLKGGYRDHYLYFLTVGLCTSIMGYSGYVFYSSIFPPPPQN